MEKDAHYFWVGIFVSILLAGIIGFLIWLAGTQGNARDYARYTVYFTDTISGLEEGADVQYKGVDVGKVLKMRLDSDREDLVKVDIEIEKTTPIRAETKAFLEMQGITGVIHLELATDPKDKKPLLRREGELYPVLEGSGSQWSMAMENLPTITQHIREISTKINRLLDSRQVKRLMEE